MISLSIEKSDFDPERGFLYYVRLNPALQAGDESVKSRVPVQAAVSISESGDLADLAFILPKPFRNEHALRFFHAADVKYVEPRVFMTFTGTSGDAVVLAAAKLDVDGAGRIVGMEIAWRPGTQTALA